jgi:hypothetical protein
VVPPNRLEPGAGEDVEPKAPKLPEAGADEVDEKPEVKLPNADPPDGAGAVLPKTPPPIELDDVKDGGGGTVEDPNAGGAGAELPKDIAGAELPKDGAGAEVPKDGAGVEEPN